jgi:hypothetical protein
MVVVMEVALVIMVVLVAVEGAVLVTTTVA